jgi:hypothetical protein
MLLSVSFAGLVMLSSAARADSIPIVTGEQWMQSSEEAKKAYLVGVANVLEIERAYYTVTPSADRQDIAPRFAKGMQGQTLDSVRLWLDRYYGTNPSRIQHPVIEDLWFELVVPNTPKNP